MDGKPSQPKEEQAKEQKRGGPGLRAIALTVAQVTRKPLGKRGLAASSLVADWSAIVGGVLAGETLPLRISFPTGERVGGTLVVQVASGPMAMQIQHLEPLIRERVNAHFGYGAVARLSLQQAPMRPKKSRKPPVSEQAEPSSEKTYPQIERMLEGIRDPELKAVLARLGRRVSQD